MVTQGLREAGTAQRNAPKGRGAPAVTAGFACPPLGSVQPIHRQATGDIVDDGVVEWSFTYSVEPEGAALAGIDIVFADKPALRREFDDLAGVQYVRIDRISVGGQEIAVRRKSQRQRAAQMRVSECHCAAGHGACAAACVGDYIDRVVRGRGDVKRIGFPVKSEAGGAENDGSGIRYMRVAGGYRGLLRQG